MRRYAKNIGLLIGVLIAQLNVFFTGAAFIKFSAASYEDITACIFDSRKYSFDFHTLQTWFICIFVFFLFTYCSLFLNLLHETPKYRSMKLYRYGKDRYLKLCRKKAVYGSLYGTAVMAAGVLFVGGILTLQGNTIHIDGAQCAAVLLQFAKLFLVMVLYGTITIYLMLRGNSSYAMCFMLFFIFMQLVVEVFTGKLHFLTYAGSYENARYIIFLILFYLAVNFFIRRSVKRMSLC